MLRVVAVLILTWRGYSRRRIFRGQDGLEFRIRYAGPSDPDPISFRFVALRQDFNGQRVVAARQALCQYESADVKASPVEPSGPQVDLLRRAAVNRPFDLSRVGRLHQVQPHRRSIRCNRQRGTRLIRGVYLVKKFPVHSGGTVAFQSRDA